MYAHEMLGAYVNKVRALLVQLPNVILSHN
jgi:hypothetical protein